MSNVMSALVDLAYIHIYISLNTLSGGKSCMVAPGVVVPTWATETVLSPWLTADEVRVLHVLSHVVWWKIYFKDLALNNLQGLIWYKTKPI